MYGIDICEEVKSSIFPTLVMRGGHVTEFRCLD